MVERLKKRNAEHTLVDVMRRFIDNVLIDTHTILPAKVLKYNSSDQTATIEFSINRSIDGEQVNYPILEEINVVYPRGNKAGLSFPLKNGDGCLVVFAERNLDFWKDQGAGGVPKDFRKFDLNDAIVVPGLFPTLEPMEPSQQEATELRGDKIFIGDLEGQPISQAEKLGLVELLIEALNQILTATYPTAMGPSGTMNPPNSTLLQNVITDLESLKV